MTTRTLLIAEIITGIVSFLVACGTPAPTPILVTPTRAAPAAAPTQLEGTRWKLELFKGQILSAGSKIDLEFQSGKVRGNSGCNSYEAGYSIPTATEMTIDDRILQTAMACLQPAGVLTQEEEYLGALRSVKHYEIQTGKLALKDIQGRELLRYQVAP